MRREFIYDSKFSKETNDSFKIFHEIREDCREILGAEKWLEPFTGTRSSLPSDEVMTKYNDYLMKYIGETNRGVLRTLLVFSKPYKNHLVIKETFNILADELRKGSTNGFI